MATPNRDLAAQLSNTYYPATGYLRKGQIGADHIQKDWTGGGTTCGFVPHWLWWRMGCTDTTLINRYEPDTSFRYTDGKNINRIFAHPSFVHLGGGQKTANDQAFIEGSIYPRTGDAIIINSGKNDDHTFVVLDAGTWDTDTKGSWNIVEGGQETGGSGHLATRRVEYKNAKWMIGNRWMIGWIDIDSVDFGKPRGASGDYLSYSSQQAWSLPSSKSPVGVWRVNDAFGNTWYYWFQKGFRVFYTRGDSPGVLAGSGYWVPQNNIVNLQWDEGGSEWMDVNGKTAIGFDISPWVGSKVKASDAVMGSFKDGRGLSLTH